MTVIGSPFLMHIDNTVHSPSTVVSIPIPLNSTTGWPRPYKIIVTDDMSCSYEYEGNVGCIYSAPTYNCSGHTGVADITNNSWIQPYTCYDPVAAGYTVTNTTGPIYSPGIFTDTTAQLINMAWTAIDECQNTAPCLATSCPPAQAVDISPTGSSGTSNIIHAITGGATPGSTNVCNGPNGGEIQVSFNAIGSTYTQGGLPIPTTWDIKYYRKNLGAWIHQSALDENGLAIPTTSSFPVLASWASGLKWGNWKYIVIDSNGCEFEGEFTIHCYGCGDPIATNYYALAGGAYGISCAPGCCQYSPNACGISTADGGNDYTLDAIDDLVSESQYCSTGHQTYITNGISSTTQCSQGAANFTLLQWPTGIVQANSGTNPDHYTAQLWWGGDHNAWNYSSNAVDPQIGQPYFMLPGLTVLPVSASQIGDPYYGDLHIGGPTAPAQLQPGDTIEYNRDVFDFGDTINSHVVGGYAPTSTGLYFTVQNMGLIGSTDDPNLVASGTSPNPWAVNYWVRVSYIDSSGSKIINPDTGNDYCDYPFTIDCVNCSGGWNPGNPTTGGGGGGTGTQNWGPGCTNIACAGFHSIGPNNLPCFMDSYCYNYSTTGSGNSSAAQPCGQTTTSPNTNTGWGYYCGNY